MLKLKLIIPAVLIVLAGCSQKVQNNVTGTNRTSDSLYVVLSVKEVIKSGTPVNLKFVVHNNKNSGQSFCKWHTPFEPLMSKYLDITDESGNEVAYKGPMAKRIMPPPADGYLVINPKDSLISNINLLKAYQLEAGKKYQISYNASGISGLKATNKVSFKYEK